MINWNDSGVVHFTPNRRFQYSLEYVEMAHAYHCGKRFHNCAMTWMDYAYNEWADAAQHDIALYMTLERMKERHELMRLAELRPYQVSR
jgi:hypothetical protein